MFSSLTFRSPWPTAAASCCRLFLHANIPRADAFARRYACLSMPRACYDPPLFRALLAVLALLFGLSVA